MGLLKTSDTLLLIKHTGLGAFDFWALPGGGVGDHSLEETLIQEFLEETGLKIEVVAFIGMDTFISQDLHALEIFFEVKAQNLDNLKLGLDPETDFQPNVDLKFIPLEKLSNFNLNSLIINYLKYESHCSHS